MGNSLRLFAADFDDSVETLASPVVIIPSFARKLESSAVGVHGDMYLIYYAKDK